MERQPKNPEFRNNPENIHPCINVRLCFLYIHHIPQTVGLAYFLKKNNCGCAHFNHLSEMLPVSTPTIFKLMLLY